MNLKSISLCLGLIASSTLGLPIAVHAATLTQTFNPPREIDYIRIVRPNNSPRTRIVVDVEACFLRPCNRANQIFATFLLPGTVRSKNFVGPFNERTIRSLTLRSNQRFRAEVKLVPEPSLSVLALGVVGATALSARKQRRTSKV